LKEFKEARHTCGGKFKRVIHLLNFRIEKTLLFQKKENREIANKYASYLDIEIEEATCGLG